MRLLYRLMLWTAALCLLLITALCLWAGDQLASPSRRPLQDYHREFLADPAAHGVSVESLTLSYATPCLMVRPRADGQLGTRGLKLRDQFKTETIALPNAGQVIGTLVLVHGRKGRKEDYLPIAERLCAVGFRCILPDMPAHGEHPEAYATFGIREADIPARALQESVEKFKFNPMPAGLMGMSMGGAVSMHAAARPDQPWQALVILSSFDRLETAIQKNVSDRVGCFLGNAWAGMAGWIYQWKQASRLRRSALICQRQKSRYQPSSPMARVIVSFLRNQENVSIWHCLKRLKNNGSMSLRPIMTMCSSPTSPSTPPWRNGCCDM